MEKQETVVVILHEQVDLYNGGYYIDHFTCGNCNAEPWKSQDEITDTCPICGAKIMKGCYTHARY